MDGTSNINILSTSGNITTSGDFNYNFAKTKYVTVSHAAFDMAMTTTSAHTHYSLSGSSTFIVRTQGGSSLTDCYLSAPIYIPDGAIVTRMDAFMYDGNSTYDVTLKLIRQTWNSSTKTVMAEVSTSGNSGQQTISDTSILNNTIDMSGYAYFLFFETKEATTFLGLYNVKITYTVTQAD